MNREDKAAIVADLSSKFEKAQIAIVTDYRGLTVSALEGLRRELKKSNSELRIAKNTLLKRAVQGTSFEGLQDFLKGTTALTVSYDDPVAPAKALTEFAKENPQLEIRTAVLDGKVLSADDLKALSSLPSKEVLLAQALSVMNAVPTSFVRVLNAVPSSFVYTLQAIKDKKEQENN